MHLILIFLFLFLIELGNSLWSFQARLTIQPTLNPLPTTGQQNSFYDSTHFLTNFGHRPFAHKIGRGFETIISAYDSTYGANIYVHNSDDGFDVRGVSAWTQNAKLVPNSNNAFEGFGKWMVAYNQTIIVSSPTASSGTGAVYVFNGTLREWTQIQKLEAGDQQLGDKFGTRLYLHRDKLLIGAEEATFTHPSWGMKVEKGGAVYVYKRPHEGLLTWSYQVKLVAIDARSFNYFGENIALYDDVTVIGARNDNGKIRDAATPQEEEGQGCDLRYQRIITGNSGLAACPSKPYSTDYGYTGTAYVFKQFSGKWSQQQKLIAEDMIFHHPDRNNEDASTNTQYPGNKKFNYDIALDGSWLVVGTAAQDARLAASETPIDAVYIFQESPTMHRWSQTQKLFANFTDNQYTELAPVTQQQTTVHIHHSTLVSVMHSPQHTVGTSSYIFQPRKQDTGTLQWTQIQRLTNGAGTGDTKLNNPALWGSKLLYEGTASIDIYSQYNESSCMLLWASDHFGDGWDIAVLTVVAPDGTNDTYYPSCNQIDPFQVRYCPHQIDDEGVYEVKVFAPTDARFFWEIQWQVQLESTGQWYRGDFSTKLKLFFSTEKRQFEFYDAENLIYFEDPCYPCTTIALDNWATTRERGDQSFFSLIAEGAPYYISDQQGRQLYSVGKACDTGSLNRYECFIRLPDGLYTLRMGGGLFGRLLLFPRTKNATYEFPPNFKTGCNFTAEHRYQFTFRIMGKVCQQETTFFDKYPMHPSNNPTEDYDRCFVPQEVETMTPTSAPTAATISVGFPDGYRRLKEKKTVGVDANGDVLDELMFDP